MVNKEKEIFFRQFEKELLIKCGIPLQTISSVRSQYLGEGKTREEIIALQRNKLAAIRQWKNGSDKQAIELHKKRLLALTRMSDKTFKILTVKTKYDK